jgi:hypothetical protein
MQQGLSALTPNPSPNLGEGLGDEERSELLHNRDAPNQSTLENRHEKSTCN